jgi:hypothetical protein
MQPQFQIVREFLGIGSFIISCCYLALNIYALARSRLWFFWILLFTSLYSVFSNLVNLGLVVYTRSAINMLGQQGFTAFYNIYLSTQLANSSMSLTGSVFLIYWVCQVRRPPILHT